jgi:signal transduction histidine kinase
MQLDEALLGRCDGARMDQVVGNLLTNAIKYGKGMPIDLTLTRLPGRARIEVRDRGIGIPQEDQSRIFDRFERAVSVRHYGGLGLGLWLVRQIVEAHGGSVGVESAPGQGATFCVELPWRPEGP